MTTQRIILAGGSGALGRALTPQLAARGFDVVVLTRSPAAFTGNVRQIQWDGKTVGPWAAELDGAEAVINFTGKSVNYRYTMRNRQEIVSSRVDSVNAIGQAIGRCSRPPKCWVQTASLAIYGDGGDRICDESAPPGSGFSVETCLRWESAFNYTNTLRTRKTIFRIGFVLGRGEGALGTLEKLTRRFLGGAVGDGRQFISWIHSSDMNRLFLEAITRADLVGTYNVTSPNPLTNAEFMRQLRRVLHRPWSPRFPRWAIKIGARLMGTEAELALTGRRCVPKKLSQAGYKFDYPLLEDALNQLYAV